MHELVPEVRVAEERRPRVHVDRAAVHQAEPARVVHPAVDGDHHQRAGDAGDHDDDAARQVLARRDPVPRVDVDRDEDRLEEEREALEREAEPEDVPERRHELRPQQPELEAEDRAGHDPDREQRDHHLRPAHRERPVERVARAQVERLDEEHERRERDPEADERDVHGERQRLHLPRLEQVRPGRRRVVPRRAAASRSALAVSDRLGRHDADDPTAGPGAAAIQRSRVDRAVDDVERRRPLPSAPHSTWLGASSPLACHARRWPGRRSTRSGARPRRGASCPRPRRLRRDCAMWYARSAIISSVTSDWASPALAFEVVRRVVGFFGAVPPWPSVFFSFAAIRVSSLDLSSRTAKSPIRGGRTQALPIARRRRSAPFEQQHTVAAERLVDAVEDVAPAAAAAARPRARSPRTGTATTTSSPRR